ncbi:MAG: hypothetical protein ABIR65_01390 [Pseudolysinimonas sp.]
MRNSGATSGPRDDRTRGVLEIVTAILLGLVSVATAIGAYQAGQWGQESSDLASASQQSRDRNLALFLESQNTSRDDGERFFDALALYAEMEFYPERTEALTAEQDVVMAAASAPLADGFAAWREAGYPLDQAPLASPEYEAQTYAATQSYNVASVVAYRASEVLEERSYRMTIVSVVFAIALLLLGVAGVSTRLEVSALLTGGGALAFIVGVAIVAFGIF